MKRNAAKIRFLSPPSFFTDRVTSDCIDQSEVEINATCSTLFCCETGFVLGIKNAQHRCSTRLAAMFRDELHVFVARVTVT